VPVSGGGSAAHGPRPTAHALSVAVVGGAGYVGGELLRILAQHPRVGRLRAFSESQAGKRWAAVHPALLHLGDGAFETYDAGTASAADVTFLALAHGRSQQLMPALAGATLVVDAAADFRVSDRALYEAHYGPHAAFELAPSFTYGLADVLGAALAGCRRIAAPGCFATATALALWPLASAGLLAGTPACFAITGSSGAGVEPKRTTHHPVRGHNFFAYALGGHRHEAELADRLRAWTGGAVSGCDLLTHSAPLVRGIHATVHARLARPCPDLQGLLRRAYEGRPFVRVLDDPPELAAVVGTNFAHLHAAARDNGETAIVTCTIDNLVKGAAGQAVQAMNLALGLPETAGLEFPGIYPC
jgi:N-acetyl-gamma-glutamyl-phosphate reductase common form